MKNDVRPVGAAYFSKILREFILTFIVDGTLYKRYFENIQALEEWKAIQRNQPELENGRYPCRSPGCNSSFKHDGVHRIRNELILIPAHINKHPTWPNWLKFWIERWCIWLSLWLEKVTESPIALRCSYYISDEKEVAVRKTHLRHCTTCSNCLLYLALQKL